MAKDGSAPQFWERDREHRGGCGLAVGAGHGDPRLPASPGERLGPVQDRQPTAQGLQQFGLSSLMAVDRTTTVASPRLSALCPTWMSAPSAFNAKSRRELWRRSTHLRALGEQDPYPGHPRAADPRNERDRQSHR